MSVFEQDEFASHEHISFFKDEQTGLKAIIAIHSTKRGPAGGGIRFFPYENSANALYDVLRLSKSMSYKSALAGLPFGGGKSVIIGDPKKIKTESLLEAFGRCVDRLGGQYYCAEDIGMTPEDMVVINRATPYVAGLPGKSGDTSPLTGYGVYQAIKAVVDYKLDGDFSSAAILGFGNVGKSLAKHLVKDGVKLYVADINKENVKFAVNEYGATEIGLEEIFHADVDVLAPCALGGVLNDDTIPKIGAKIICGGANNQLKEVNRHGKMLDEKGILFIPDYVANAGGLISGSSEVMPRSEEETLKMVENIYNTCMNILKIAEKNGCIPVEASETLAEEIIRG